MMTAHLSSQHGVVWTMLLCYMIIYRRLKSVSLTALQQDDLRIHVACASLHIKKYTIMTSTGFCSVYWALC